MSFSTIPSFIVPSSLLTSVHLSSHMVKGIFLSYIVTPYLNPTTYMVGNQSISQDLQLSPTDRAVLEQIVRIYNPAAITSPSFLSFKITPLLNPSLGDVPLTIKIPSSCIDNSMPQSFQNPVSSTAVPTLETNQSNPAASNQQKSFEIEDVTHEEYPGK